MDTEPLIRGLLDLLGRREPGGKGLSPREARDWTLAEYLSLYKTFRDYVMVESGLINTRLGWLLTVNGFLFAGFGLGVQSSLTSMRDHAVSLLSKADFIPSDKASKADIASARAAIAAAQAGINTAFEHTRIEQHLFLLVICVAAIAICSIGYIAILAARASSKAATALFEEIENLPHELREDLFKARPDSVGKERRAYRAPTGVHLPHIRGGGLKWTVDAGLRAADVIVLTLIAIWALLAAGMAATLMSKDW
jgi:hypothetical protein